LGRPKPTFILFYWFPGIRWLTSFGFPYKFSKFTNISYYCIILIDSKQMKRALITALILYLLLTGYISYALPSISISNTLMFNSNVIMPSDTIPVVVHVIHTGTPIGSPDNPPDSLINELLNQMNAAFQLDGPLYGGADIGFAFQLATRSPTCTTSTGINRIDGSGIPLYATGGITGDTNFNPNSAYEVPVKGLSRWPNTDYLNIWIVNTIDNNPFWPGGYAYFPEYNGARIDGIVLRASVVNGTNKTIIHELGHYFSLYHTFGYAWDECMPDTNCLINGDLICDTENCINEYDCSSITNICTSEEWIVVDPEHEYTVLNNYMGYTDCQWMFTEDQKTRMQYALNTFRPGLLSSLALDNTELMTPSQACIPSSVNGLSAFYGIERVDVGSLNVYSNTSLADGAFYVDRTCNQQVEVEAGDSIPIRITPSYLNWSQVRLFIDYNNDGTFAQSGESILSSEGWIIEDTIVVPLSQITMCVPLRLRVVVDHWDAPQPTACLLTGNMADGVGQIEDYSLIIRPRHIESVSSGGWTTPGIWSCNCIPGASDEVTIKSGHTVTITPAMGSIQCADVHLQPNALLQMDGVMHVAGGCN